MESLKFDSKINFGPIGYVYIRYFLNGLYLLYFLTNIKSLLWIEILLYSLGIFIFFLTFGIYHYYLTKKILSNKIHYFIFLFDITIIFFVYSVIAHQSALNAAIIWKSPGLLIIPIFS
jgi:hypothetical protein